MAVRGSSCGSPDPSLGRLEGKKAVILLGCLELGGAERQAMLLARWLKERCGVSVEVWGVAHGGSLEGALDRLGIPWRITGNPLLPGRLATAQRLCRIARLLRRTGCDILLPYTLVPNVICGASWRLSGARLCVWNQRDEGVEGRRDPFQRFALSFTPLFVANSAAGAQYLVRELGVDPVKVNTVPNGLALAPPAASAKQWRRTLQLCDDALCVGMLGHLSDKKDHVTLLHAWRQVLDAARLPPGKLKLVLAGREAGEGVRLAGLAASLGLADRVTFAGGVDDVAGFLQAVDIAVYSSRSEGLPNGVLECMAMGKVVVATDIPGIREALGEEYPLLCSPGDAAGMADRLLGLIADPESARAFGEANRRRAEARFGAEAMCRRMSQLIVDHLGMKERA